MFNQSKSSFWSRRNSGAAVEEEPQAAPEADSRLGSLMDQLDAGIAQSTERERANQAGRQRKAAAAEVQIPTAAQWVVAGLAEEGPKTSAAATEEPEIVTPLPAKPVPHARPEKPIVAARPPQAPTEIRQAPVELRQPVVAAVTGVTDAVSGVTPADTAETDPATSQALSATTEQRKAAEALLLEACILEERIQKEAAAAAATRAYEAAEKNAESAAAKAQAAVQAEEDVRTAAETALREHSQLRAELKSIEEAIVVKHGEADAAKAEVAELENRLAEAQRNAQSALADLELHEVRKQEHAAKETAAANAATESAARLVASKTERETAQAEAEAARERARVLKAELPVADASDSQENVERLAARIAEQVQLARRARNGFASRTDGEVSCQVA